MRSPVQVANLLWWMGSAAPSLTHHETSHTPTWLRTAAIPTTHPTADHIEVLDGRSIGGHQREVLAVHRGGSGVARRQRQATESSSTLRTRHATCKARYVHATQSSTTLATDLTERRDDGGPHRTAGRLSHARSRLRATPTPRNRTRHGGGGQHGRARGHRGGSGARRCTRWRCHDAGRRQGTPRTH